MPVTRKALAIAAALVAGAAAIVFSDTPSPTQPANANAAIDALFAQWNRPDSPGCIIGISRHGKTVHERGYGMASLELKVPLTPDTVLPIASVSKQFTAMSILLLARRGKLSLDDEVRKHVQEWAGPPVTIRQLLTHTGGVRDVFLLIELAAAQDGPMASRLVKWLTRQRGLNFTPGSEYQYNNGGYLLLGTIVARVSGQSLRAFADANIFRPLGMTHTHFHDDPDEVVPNRGSNYRRSDDDGLKLVMAESGGFVGNGGLFTTAGDLLRWAQNFAEPRVGDAALLASMQKPAVLSDGHTSNYGYGLQINTYRGLRAIEHGGGDRGISAYLTRYPDQGLAVAVLCNQAVDALTPTRRVADIYLREAMAPDSTSPEPRRATLSAAQLASTEGLYRNPATEGLLHFFVRDGKLMGNAGTGTDNAWEAAPENEHRFFIPTTTIALEFVPDGSGRSKEVRVIGERPETQVLQRVAAFTPPSRTQLDAMAGDYTNEELEVTYAIAATDAGLTVQIPGRAAHTMRPIFPDGFTGPLFEMMKVSRDARGRVDGFTIHTGGVRKLRFERAQ